MYQGIGNRAESSIQAGGVAVRVWTRQRKSRPPAPSSLGSLARIAFQSRGAAGKLLQTSHSSRMLFYFLKRLQSIEFRSGALSHVLKLSQPPNARSYSSRRTRGAIFTDRAPMRLCRIFSTNHHKLHSAHETMAEDSSARVPLPSGLFYVSVLRALFLMASPSAVWRAI